MGKKDKLAVYLTPEKKAELEQRFHEDGSRSMTAFIERALDFYLDYLSAQDAGLFLPAAIRSCIEGISAAQACGECGACEAHQRADAL